METGQTPLNLLSLACVCRVWIVSLMGSKLGVDGGAAMAGALPQLTLLTTLKYVCEPVSLDAVMCECGMCSGSDDHV